TVESSSVVFSLLLDLMLLMSGMGLLMRQGWARWSSIAYAVVSILLKLFLTVYFVAFVYPPTNAFIQEQVRMTPQGQQPGFATGVSFGLFAGVCLDVVFIISPLAVLVASLRPSAAELFAPERGRRRRRHDDDEDDYDEDDYDDRPRRRRRDEDDYDE